MNPKEYVDLFVSGQENQSNINGLCGRLIRGKNPDDFKTLTDDPERKIVMLIDPEGLQKMLGKTGYEMLIEVGYEPDYLVHKINEGNQFKLVVFSSDGAAKLATWDNIFEMVKKMYPQVIFPIAIQSALVDTAFDNLERKAGFSFLDVEKIGKSDKRFMTYERFLESNQSLVDYRAFLYFSIHLRELYSGDGWTYDSNGNKGVMEYIIPNLPLAQLGSYEIVDIDVDLPNGN